MAYIKLRADGAELIAMNTATGEQRALLLPMEEDILYVVACTGDGHLVLVSHDEPPSITLWKPNGILQEPHRVVELEAADGNRAPCDAWSEQKAIVGILVCATLDSMGRILISEQERAGNPSSVRRITTTLVPPVHFIVVPASAETQGPGRAWQVLGCKDKVLQDMQHLLQAGAGADVHILAAGGEVLKAHSQVLCARWPWYRAQQERWQQGGGAAGSSTGGGKVHELHASEHPAAAMRAVLDWLYTGHAVLLDPQDLPDGEAQVGGSTSSAPAGSAGTSAVHTPTSHPPAAAGSSGAAPAPDRAESPPSEASAHAAAELLVAVMHAAGAFELPELQTACLDTARCSIRPECAVAWLIAAHPYSATGNGGAQAGHDPAFEGLKSLALAYASEHYDDIKARAPASLDALKAQPAELAMELMEARVAAVQRRPGGGGGRGAAGAHGGAAGSGSVGAAAGGLKRKRSDDVAAH